MPGAYSTDLRERGLVAVESGEPADAVAEEFMVGRSSVYRSMAAAHDEGRRAPKPMGRGPNPIIRDETEVALCRLLEADNHLTFGMPRSLGGRNRRAGQSLDGWPRAAAVGLDVKETQHPAR